MWGRLPAGRVVLKLKGQTELMFRGMLPRAGHNEGRGNWVYAAFQSNFLEERDKTKLLNQGAKDVGCSGRADVDMVNVFSDSNADDLGTAKAFTAIIT